jgi:hypothetical protein
VQDDGNFRNTVRGSVAARGFYVYNRIHKAKL